MSIGRTGAKPTFGSGGADLRACGIGAATCGLGAGSPGLGGAAAVCGVAWLAATTTVVTRAEPGNSEQKRECVRCSCDNFTIAAAIW